MNRFMTLSFTTACPPSPDAAAHLLYQQHYLLLRRVQLHTCYTNYLLLRRVLCSAADPSLQGRGPPTTVKQAFVGKLILLV